MQPEIPRFFASFDQRPTAIADPPRRKRTFNPVRYEFGTPCERHYARSVRANFHRTARVLCLARLNCCPLPCVARSICGEGQTFSEFSFGDDSSTLWLALFLRRPVMDACRGRICTQLTAQSKSALQEPASPEIVCPPDLSWCLASANRSWLSSGPHTTRLIGRAIKVVPQQKPKRGRRWPGPILGWATAFGISRVSEPGANFGI